MSSSFPGPGSFLQNQCRPAKNFKCYRERRRLTGNNNTRRGNVVCGWPPPPPVDPWALNIDSASISQQLFAASLFPYLGFLYFITKSKSAPKLTLFGFYFLLAFVGATTNVHYGTSLSNVDWLHGGAESLLTLTNLFIALGLRQALRRARNAKRSTQNVVLGIKEEKPSI